MWHLLSRCSAAGTPLKPEPNLLCRHPKGSVKFKSSCLRGAGRWRTEGSASSLLPARKQHRCMKRGLWFQTQLRPDHEAVSLGQYAKIIVSTKFYKLAARLQRFKCTSLSSLHFPHWNKSLCNNKWGFPAFPDADERCLGAFHLAGRRNERLHMMEAEWVTICNW